MNLSTFKQTRLRKSQAQRSDKLFYQHRHSNPLTPEKDPSRTCRFARTKREEEQKSLFLQQERDKKSSEEPGSNPVHRERRSTTNHLKADQDFPFRADKEEIEAYRFSSKEIEDQLLLAIAGIEPSSFEPALNPALQSWKLNLAPQDLAELRVTRGQRGASSI